MSDVKLSAPWYTFANQIKYTYGLSPYITVNDLIPINNGYVLNIIVCNDKIATALRAVLPVSRDFGNVVVSIVISNSKGNIVPVDNTAYTPETLATTLCTALYRNPIFVGTVLLDPVPGLPLFPNVAVIIKKHIVQFYNDDLSDVCNNYNEVASKTFTEISNLIYNTGLSITFTTQDLDCPLQKRIYCPSSRCIC